MPAEEISFLTESDRLRTSLLERVSATSSRILVLGDDATLILDIQKNCTAKVVWLTANALPVNFEPKTLEEVRVLELTDWESVSFAHRFDCVIWESLAASPAPRPLLRRIREWLTPDGLLLTSIANVRRRDTVSALLRGTWAPNSPGTTEKPLRFFTRREIEKLLFRAGFELQNRITVALPEPPDVSAQHSRGTVQLHSLSVTGLEEHEVQEFAAERYILEATPGAAVDDGLTSIILVTFNELAYTRKCLDSVRLFTDEPYELIVVDNGSTDGTVEHLLSLGRIQVISNGENRGFPAAANQGIRAARGRNLLLLNNDTVVTSGWLRRMLDVLHRSPDVGLVGPCSNRCSGPQEVPAGYDRLEALDGFAWDWGQRNAGRMMEFDRLVGFCLLFRRTVLDQIGLLDERFGIGNFEDDDFCRRARMAGFRAVIALDAFVHHFGSRTFLGSGVDFAGLLEENRQKYETKWKDVPTGESSDALPAPMQIAEAADRLHFTVRQAPTGGLLLQPSPVRLSLCMIVRDNESTIGPCLESIRPYVDEIVVVDTGSTDRTPEICRAYGAQLHQFPWCNDFSAARNASLGHARGEWIFWMDSDDTIPPDCARRLRELAESPHDPTVLGYIVQVHCPGPFEEGPIDVTVVDHVKLIRNRPDLRFEGRIHEQLLPAIRRAQGEVAWTDLYVVHSGSDHSEEMRQRKLDRDYRILHQELAERPDHPFVLFNLGMTYADGREYDEAIRYLQRCLTVSRPEESHLRKAYSLLVSSLGQADRHDEAWEVCQQGLTLYPEDKELLFRSAILHQHFGRLKQAEAAYLQVMEQPVERYFASIDHGLCSYKARHNLALVYDDMGRDRQAEQQWRQILDEVPDYLPAWRGLAETLLARGDEAALEAEIFRRLAQDGRPRIEGFLLRGRWQAQAQNFAAALQDLEAADRLAPHDLEALRTRCRIHFEQGPLDAAAESLRELVRRAPDDAAGHHNLGTVFLQQGEFGEAARAFEESLRLRHASESTRRQLEHARAQLAGALEVISPFNAAQPAAPSVQGGTT